MRRFLGALGTLILVGTLVLGLGVSVEGQGPFAAQIQQALRSLGLLNGGYTNGQCAGWSTSLLKFIPTTCAGGSGGTPGGSTTQVQYNNAGAFGGITGATTNGTALTLVAPVLGTPASATLTNATGLPLTGLTGLGTGVATALGVNIGSAGAFVTFNGALGTPSSGTLTHATGLPWSGVTSTPTTFSGYGISDTLANLLTAISATIAGNTTLLMTGSGSFVSGNCLETNAGHNIIDAGAPCGSGGGGADALGNYLVASSSHAPANAVNLGALSTGIQIDTISGGVATPSAYAGTSCTNQFPRSLSATGVATCSSVLTTDITSVAWAKITSTPTTFAGYGIVDTAANLSTAIGGQTIGSGNVVRASSPTIVSPLIGYLVTATKTANYTFGANDGTVPADSSAGTFTVTIPVASALLGRVACVVKVDSTTTAVTIASGGGTINGSSTQTLNAQWGFLCAESDTTNNWEVIGSGGPTFAPQSGDAIFYLRHSDNSLQPLGIGTGLSLSSGTLSATGGGGTPGGSDTNIQFNASGAFAGNAAFVTNESTTNPQVQVVGSGTGAEFDVRSTYGTGAVLQLIGAGISNTAQVESTEVSSPFSDQPLRLTASDLRIDGASSISVANVGANSCGTTAATLNSAANDTLGKVTVGATSGTQCRLTFSDTAQTIRFCLVNNEAGVLATTTYVDTTHTDLKGVFAAGATLDYLCFAQ